MYLFSFFSLYLNYSDDHKNHFILPQKPDFIMVLNYCTYIVFESAW